MITLMHQPLFPCGKSSNGHTAGKQWRTGKFCHCRESNTGQSLPNESHAIVWPATVRSKYPATNCSTLKADSHIAWRAHAVLLPWRAANGLEYVFPIWFTQCGCVSFTLAMPLTCHALTMPWPWEEGMVRAWQGRGMAGVNQTRPHCVNQMGKTHSRSLAARYGRGTAWARHAMCESALNYTDTQFSIWRT